MSGEAVVSFDAMRITLLDGRIAADFIVRGDVVHTVHADCNLLSGDALTLQFDRWLAYPGVTAIVGDSDGADT